MNQNISTYYIPQNLNIPTGKIYEFYLNKVTNLELSSILKKPNITLNTIITPNQEIPQNPKNILLKENEYKEILNLAAATEKLYNQSQTLIKKLKIGCEKHE